LDKGCSQKRTRFGLFYSGISGDRERENRLVHNDYGNFPLENTFEEIYALYKNSTKFVECFPNALKKFTENNREERASAQCLPGS